MEYFRAKTAVILLSLLMAGCAGLKAPIRPNGQPVNIFLISDRGNPDTMDQMHWDEQDQAGEYMEKDLVYRLTRAGYNVRQVKDRGEFTPGEGNFLLIVAIRNFNKGSKIGVVQFGVGWTELDTAYELSGNLDDSLARDSVVSRTRDDFPDVNTGMPGFGSPDWKDCVKRNNQYTIEGITRRLIKELSRK